MPAPTKAAHKRSQRLGEVFAEVSFGFQAFRVDAPAAFGPALRAALKAGKPSLVEVDMEAVGPYATLFGGPVLDKRH